MDELDASLRAILGSIAWAAIEEGLARTTEISRRQVDTPRRVDLASLPPRLRQPGASFVTLHRHGTLRGCIGTTRAYQPLAQDVSAHAFAAAFSDPRFSPLRRDERDGLTMEISVLGPSSAVPADDEDTLLLNLRPGTDGLILASGNRGATFLPSVWAGLPEPRSFIHALLAKAGLSPRPWPRLTAHTYQVQKWQVAMPATGV